MAEERNAELQLGPTATAAAVVRALKTGPPSDPARLWYIPVPTARVTNIGSAYLESTDGWVGSDDARVIGIQDCEVVEDLTRLVASDSFGPCIPVIALGLGGCAFAHCNGLSLASTFVAAARRIREAPAIVIRKTGGTPAARGQHERATAMAKLIEGLRYPVTIMDVPATDTIGVVAYGATRSVLAYAQL